MGPACGPAALGLVPLWPVFCTQPGKLQVLSPAHPPGAKNGAVAVRRPRPAACFPDRGPRRFRAIRPCRNASVRGHRSHADLEIDPKLVRTCPFF